MIEYKTGDILAEDTEAIVNTVNCVGIMGRGIALQFKNAYPANFKAYAAACKRKEVQLGRMFTFETRQLTNPRVIINFPTKQHWRGKSRMEDIDLGLRALAEVIHTRRIRSIAIPPLGSGLGGLEWPRVRPRIKEALRNLNDLRIVIFEPRGASETDKMIHAYKVPRMTPARASLVGLVHRYLGALLDPFVTLLEVHKLMYFMQEAGQPLQLKYEKAHYGPYAKNLRHVLNAIEGHLISGYADGGDDPEKRITLLAGAIEAADAFIDYDHAIRARFDRVADLVAGFESPFGLELLTTAHWVIKRESIKTVDDAVGEIYAWGNRKKYFSERQVALAVDTLSRKGWIDNIPVN